MLTLTVVIAAVVAPVLNFGEFLYLATIFSVMVILCSGVADPPKKEK